MSAASPLTTLDAQLARGPTPHPAGAWGVVRPSGEIVDRYLLRWEARSAARREPGLRVVRVDDRVSGRMSLRRIESRAAVAPLALAAAPSLPPATAPSLPRVIFGSSKARFVKLRDGDIVLELRQEDAMGETCWRRIDDYEVARPFYVEAILALSASRAS